MMIKIFKIKTTSTKEPTKARFFWKYKPNPLLLLVNPLWRYPTTVKILLTSIMIMVKVAHLKSTVKIQNNTLNNVSLVVRILPIILPFNQITTSFHLINMPLVRIPLALILLWRLSQCFKPKELETSLHSKKNQTWIFKSNQFKIHSHRTSKI